MSRYECCGANAGNAVVPMPWHEYHGTNAWHECCGVNAMAQRLWHECQSGLGIRYFAHSLFCSKSLILKCNHERFTLGCKKQAICLKNLYFLFIFDSFVPFLCQELIAQKTDSKFPTLMPVHECHGTNTIVKMPGCECCGVNAMSPMPRQKCCG